MAKTVFIAHPISGDVPGNIQKVLKICAEVHTEHVIPVVPYLACLQYLDETDVEDRDLGIAAGLEYLRRGFVDELWLYGDHISSGMHKEVLLAREQGIPVIPKTSGSIHDIVCY